MAPKNSRDEILGKLKAAPETQTSPRPLMPPLNELSWDREQMIEAFAENLDALTGIFHRVNDRTGVLEKLSEIAASEGLTEVMASTDDVVADLDLRSWGKETGVPVFTAADFEDRESFKERVFEKADAGITGANFAIAESGTLCLVHDKDQARLVSLAPIIHIAIVPSDRLFPTYETVTDQIFAEGENPPPGHVTFITGPSMTGDIQGIPFKGMHGPKKLIVILIG